MSERILLVDDEPAVQDTVGRFLVGQGFDVVGAVDGQQAIATLRSAPIDAMVLDLQLPKLSGLDVLRSIREQQLEAGVVIAITGRGFVPELAFHSLELGAAGFIAKPFDLAILGCLLESELKLRESKIAGRSVDSRRKYPRMKLCVPVEIDVASFGATMSGTMLNLSRGGLLATVENEVAVGEQVAVRLLIYGTGETRIGTVRRAGHADTGYEIVVEFDEPIPKVPAPRQKSGHL